MLAIKKGGMWVPSVSADRRFLAAAFCVRINFKIKALSRGLLKDDFSACCTSRSIAPFIYSVKSFMAVSPLKVEFYFYGLTGCFLLQQFQIRVDTSQRYSTARLRRGFKSTPWVSIITGLAVILVFKRIIAISKKYWKKNFDLSVSDIKNKINSNLFLK
jgi:hypothetical protein